MSELAALEPLRAALLARANTDADRVRAAAEQDGQETIDQARKQAAAALADARSQGETEGAALLVVDRARARRTARSVVLTAQRDAYDELRRQACDAVRRLLDDPARQARLAAVVRGKLGEDAVIREQPGGGMTAGTPDGRSIDASVEALVDTALADLELEQLWTAG